MSFAKSLLAWAAHYKPGRLSDPLVVRWMGSGTAGSVPRSLQSEGNRGVLNGILAHSIFWPQTEFSFIWQLSQHAMVGEQSCLFASDPFESKMGEGGHLGI